VAPDYAGVRGRPAIRGHWRDRRCCLMPFACRPAYCDNGKGFPSFKLVCIKKKSPAMRRPGPVTRLRGQEARSEWRLCAGARKGSALGRSVFTSREICMTVIRANQCLDEPTNSRPNCRSCANLDHGRRSASYSERRLGFGRAAQVRAMSALPPKADIGTQSWKVRFVRKQTSAVNHSMTFP
jgi:hypothetical protein